MGDWTTRVALRTRRGIIFVRRAGGIWWDLVGGKKDPHDKNWRCTGVREVLEEPGFAVSRARLRCHEVSHNKQGKRGRYSLHHCSIIIPVSWLRRMKSTGPEGEEVRLFSYKKIRRMKDIAPKDLAYLEQQNLLRSPRRQKRRRA